MSEAGLQLVVKSLTPKMDCEVCDKPLIPGRRVFWKRLEGGTAIGWHVRCDKHHRSGPEPCEWCNGTGKKHTQDGSMLDEVCPDCKGAG